MKKRLAIQCLSLMLLAAGLLGCEASTRYHVLCFLFDGVPAPPGMAPCNGSTGPAAATTASVGVRNEAPRRYVQHGPYAARLCDGCHQRQTNRLILPKEELCLNCHVMETAKRKVHGPLASGGCIECHNPHGSGYPYLLVADSREFCLYCHRREDLMKDKIHRSSDEACTTCHNAHASDNDYLLRDAPGEVLTRSKRAPKLTGAPYQTPDGDGGASKTREHKTARLSSAT